MKYTVVTRTVQIHETEIDLDFGPLVSDKQADALVRQGSRKGLLAEQMEGAEPKLVSSKTNVSSVKRGTKTVFGLRPVAAKIEDAEQKATNDHPPLPQPVTSDEHPKANL